MIRPAYLDAARYLWGAGVRCVATAQGAGLRLELVRPGRDPLVASGGDAARVYRVVERAIRQALLGHVDAGERLLRRLGT